MVQAAVKVEVGHKGPEVETLAASEMAAWEAADWVEGVWEEEAMVEGALEAEAMVLAMWELVGMVGDTTEMVKAMVVVTAWGEKEAVLRAVVAVEAVEE